MRSSTFRLAAGLTIVVLLFSACTSRSDGGADTAASVDKSASTAGLAAENETAESTVGITDDQINVAFIGVDFSALASTGMVPELGDQEKQVTSLAEDINESGGIAGRQINLHVQMLDYIVGNAQAAGDAIQAACIAATQEFHAAVVILPPATPRQLAYCTSVTNQTLTIHTTGFDQELFQAARGRLFAPSGMSIDRQYRGWVQEMDRTGALEGKTIGIVSGEEPAEFSGPIDAALVPEIEALGHHVEENITLPCESGATSCEQYDAAAQRLKNAGVDVVFMALANTLGPPLVQAAADVGYEPQWLMEGGAVTPTVTQFFDSVAEPWDGAIGVGNSFTQNDDLPAAAYECNEIVAERSGEKYEPGSGAFAFTAAICGLLRFVETGMENAAGSELNQGELISAIEALGSFPGPAGREMSLSPTKHDAQNHLYVCDYRATEGECVRRDAPPFEVE